MKKVIDFDKIFESFVKKCIAENKGVYTADDWEDKLPKLYDDFESTAFAELDGLTPATYYNDDKDALLPLAVKHIESKVIVSDYLTDAIVKYTPSDKIIELLSSEQSNELLSFLIGVLDRKDAKIPFNEYCSLLVSKSVSGDVKESVISVLKDNADVVKDRLLQFFDAKVIDDSVLCEILSSARKHDDRILALLIDCFKRHQDKKPEFVSYLVEYGDEGALVTLNEAIRSTEIGYVDFKELKLAIEALGGEYKEERDFSEDKAFKLLHSNNEHKD